MPDETAIGVAAALETADDMSAIKAALRAFAGSFGYDRFVLFSASAARDEVIERIYWVEGDWFGDGGDVDAETYIRRCPVNRHIVEVQAPFFWTKTTKGSAELYRVVRSPRGRGVHGLQIPVFGPLGLEGAVSLGGERIDASPQTRIALTVIGREAFAAARRLLEAPAETTGADITAREREILTWVAAGRRQGEIAAALGLSERTVENHLRRIRRRLGVATTAQAIRIAIRRGDIVA